MNQSLTFSSGQELRQWFRENHSSSPGLWIRFRYDQTPSFISSDEAHRIALSFGWVDDRIKRINDQTYRKKFIPRRQGSPWTEPQKSIVAELIQLRRMEKPGLDAVARAKADGSWDSDASPITDEMLEIFTSVLRPYEPAFTHFLRLPPVSQRNLTLNYLSAKKSETRARRLATIVSKLNEGHTASNRRRRKASD